MAAAGGAAGLVAGVATELFFQATDGTPGIAWTDVGSAALGGAAAGAAATINPVTGLGKAGVTLLQAGISVGEGLLKGDTSLDAMLANAAFGMSGEVIGNAVHADVTMLRGGDETGRVGEAMEGFVSGVLNGSGAQFLSRFFGGGDEEPNR